MRWTLLLLALVCALGLGLRLYALGWGLPYVEHPDEPALVEVAVRMVREGDLHPRNFLYPSLFFYAMAGVTWLHAWWGVQQGLYGSLADLPVDTYLYTSAPDLYLWNRALSVVLGALTVPALAALGWRMFDRRVALLAALLLAVARFHVEHSHFITTDAATGLWVVLALLGAWRVASDGGWSGYLLGGLACGLAAGTKYNAGVVALALAAAHLLFWRADSLRASGRLLACGALSLLTFVLTTPYALLDWPRFLAALRFNAEHYASGSHGDMVGRWPLGEYAEVLWTLLLFPSGTLVLLVVLPVLVRRFPRQSALVGLVVVAELALLLSYAVHFVRNLLPIVPLLLLLLAAGAVALTDWLRQRLAERGPAWARGRAGLASGLLLGALALAALAPQANNTAWLLGYWGRPYTLVAAAEALRAQPRGLPAAVESNPVQWAGDPAAIPFERLTGRDATWYRAAGIRYLLLSEDRHRDDPQAAALAAAGRVLAAFPERRAGVQPGPGATLVDLAPRPEDLAITRRPTVFSDTIELLGYAVQPGPPRARLEPLEQPTADRLSAGAGMQLNMVWRALRQLDRDYTLFIHVLAPDGSRVAQRDLPLRAADYPSSRWTPGELVLDSADLDTSGLPPGVYRVLFGLYDASGARLPVSAGDPEGVLMTVTVE
ncbi:MAG TPA: glycosyltransferase family 39 protein [Roseiflexaceae bacterium]|nr:glycosyltransferase family 39 protein [Roseiflexaceae bacterium]